MMLVAWIVMALAAVFFVVFFAWRWASRRWSLPCPSLFAWMFEGSLVDRLSGTQLTLDRLRLQPGQTILEVGPGPGRLLIPASFRILPGGRAIGIDVQHKRIERLKSRASAAGAANLTPLVGDAAALKLERDTVDLVYLCTVLGEVPDRARALAEAFRVLKPGGAISITEIKGDPHYQSRAKVDQLARAAGFEPVVVEGGFWMYTATFRKPRSL
jgi:ubiquinone/menaquinone biosynthesis C-methylase UbiE